MTDYPASRQGRNRSSWKQAQIQKKGREILAIFIVAVLGFLLLSGFLKAINIKNEISRSVWEGRGAVAVAINSQTPTLVVYQKEPPKVAFFSIANNLNYATGNPEKPVDGITTSIVAARGDETTAILTNLLGININKYYFFKDRLEITRDNYESFFKDFASLKTPVGLFFGKVGDLGSTNLTQAELFNLWWQVKGLSLKQVDYLALDSFADEIVGPKNTTFKGIDREKANIELSKYFRDSKEKSMKVQIKNATGVVGTTRLAVELVESYGWTVVGVEPASQETSTYILADKKDAEASDLAKLFACDIVLTQGEQNEGQVVVVLGEDFAKRFF